MTVTYTPAGPVLAGTDVTASDVPLGREYYWALRRGSAWERQPHTNRLDYHIPNNTDATHARICWSARTPPPAVIYTPSRLVLPEQSVTAALVNVGALEISSYQWQFQTEFGTDWADSSAPGASTPTLTVPITEPPGYKYRITWVRWGVREYADRHVEVDGRLPGLGSRADPYRITDAHLRRDIDVTDIYNQRGTTWFEHRPTNVHGLWTAWVRTTPNTDFDTRFDALGSDGVSDDDSEITQGDTPHELFANVQDLAGRVLLKITDHARNRGGGVSVRIDKPAIPAPDVRYTDSHPVGGERVTAVIADPVHVVGYRWEIRLEDGPSGWAPATDDAGWNTITLTIPADVRVGVEYRIVLRMSDASWVPSGRTITTRARVPRVTAYSDYDPAPGESVTATFDITAGIDSYQWQYDDGGTWTDVSGATTATITLSNTAAVGTEYRLTYVAGGETHIADFTFRVEHLPPPSVSYSTRRPAPNDVVTATLSDTTRVASYQWQTLTGDSWVASSATGATTITLRIPSGAASGAQYRLTWTTISGAAHSTDEHVVVSEASQYGSVFQNYGADEVFDEQSPSAVFSDLSGLTIGWQSRTPPSDVWSDVAGADQGTLSVPAETRDGTQFRVTWAHSSDNVTHYAESWVTYYRIRFLGYTNETPAVGDTITASFHGLPQTGVTFQWQSRTHEAGAWEDVQNQTQDELLIPANAPLGWQYRIVWTHEGHTYAASNFATVTAPAAVEFVGYNNESPHQGSLLIADFTNTRGVTFQWQAFVEGVWRDTPRATEQSLTIFAREPVGRQLRITWSVRGTRHYADTYATVTQQAVAYSEARPEISSITRTAGTDTTRETYEVEFAHEGSGPLPHAYVLESSASESITSPARGISYHDLSSPITFALSAAGEEGRYFRLRHQYDDLSYGPDSPVFELSG